MYTVIIPTFNASERLPLLLGSLKRQSIKPGEIIIIDSSSTDNTLDIAKSHNAKTITIEQSQFNHGRTRTLAAKQAKGDILIYFTQDAMPYNSHALEEIIKPLESDPKIAAVYGRQLARTDASVFAQHLRLFNYSTESYIRKLSDREKFGIRTAFFSNSFAAYRKKDLREIGYFNDNLIFGEDTYAAAKMLLNDKMIAYAADAKVYHSHNHTIIRDFKRYFDMGVFHHNSNWLLTDFGSAQSQASKYIRSEAAFLIEKNKLHLFFEFALRIAFKYIGYKAGRSHCRFPTWLNRRLSLNRIWWDTQD